MDITRIRDIPNYQGDTEAFMDFNAAIWKKAVGDEYKKAKQILFGYIMYEICRINGRKIKKEITQKAIDIVSPELLKTVKENINEESERWPENSRKGHSYKIYKAAVMGIVTELMKGDADGQKG